MTAGPGVMLDFYAVCLRLSHMPEIKGDCRSYHLIG